ncbi:hypothetical protein LTR17_001293 [Elasticomyces elasticus]|nr:hypothetical protein LTR17_001293 [Elasticomyces elasticus]
MFSGDIAQSLNGDDTLGAVRDELEDFVELAAAEDICDSQLGRAHEILALIYGFLSLYEPEDEQEAKLVKVTDLMDSMQLADADPQQTGDSGEGGSASVPDGRRGTENQAAGAKDEAKEKSTEDESGLQPRTTIQEPTIALTPTKPWRRFASPIHSIGLCAARDIQPFERIMSQDSIHNLGGGAFDDASGLYNKLLSDKDSDAAVIAMLSVTKIAPVKYAMPLRTIEEFRRAFDADGMALSECMLKHLVTRCYFPYVKGNDVCRLVSRAWQLNHSCAPSAEAAWNGPGQRLDVRALRAIKKGEEITIPYVDIYEKAPRRWFALGFACNCKVCLPKVSDNEGFQAREIRLTLISEGLKTIRAYRDKYACTVSELTKDIAQAVANDPQTDLVMTSIVKRLGQRVNQLGIWTSELDILYEVQSFTHRARFLVYGESSDFDSAIDLKGKENTLLSERLGLHHPRTKKAMREGLALVHEDLGRLTEGFRMDAELAMESGESNLESLEFGTGCAAEEEE